MTPSALEHADTAATTPNAPTDAAATAVFLPPRPWTPNAFHSIRGLLLETTLDLLRLARKER